MNKRHRAILLIVLSVLLLSCSLVSVAPSVVKIDKQSARYADYWMDEDNKVVIHTTWIMQDDFAYDEETLLVALGNIKSQHDSYFTEEAYQRQIEIMLGAYEFAYPYWHPNLKAA